MIRSIGAVLLFLFATFGAASAQTCTVPNTLANGSNADATQVMANFNALLSCINGGSGSSIGDGTTTISPGVNSTYLFNNAGVLGHVAIGQMPGIATSTAAAPGNVGETGTVSASITLSSGPQNITSQLIQPGDWLIWGNVSFGGSGATNTHDYYASISTTSATIGSGPNQVFQFRANYADAAIGATVGPIRVHFSSATTYYLVASQTVNSGAFGSAVGTLSWSRER
ncbi:MAG: hypothetical protein ABI192_17615 [Bradyrhizobium sp.]